MVHDDVAERIDIALQSVQASFVGGSHLYLGGSHPLIGGGGRKQCVLWQCVCFFKGGCGKKMTKVTYICRSSKKKLVTRALASYF